MRTCVAILLLQIGGHIWICRIYNICGKGVEVEPTVPKGCLICLMALGSVAEGLKIAMLVCKVLYFSSQI